MHNFSSLLNITLHVADGLSVHHQEFKNVHTATGIRHTEIPEIDKITVGCVVICKTKWVKLLVCMYVRSSKM
jgi:hypothetical protein